MQPLRRLASASALAAILALCASSANAAPTDRSGATVAPTVLEPSSARANEWRLVKTKVKWRGNAVAMDALDKAHNAEILYSGPSGRAGDVAFTCMAGGLSLSVTTEPGDLYQHAFNAPDSRRFKRTEPVVAIDGKRIKTYAWLDMVEMDVIRARRMKTMGPIYNAALRGRTVVLDMARGEDIVLNLPTANDDFKAFGAACGLGRNADR